VKPTVHFIIYCVKESKASFGQRLKICANQWINEHEKVWNVIKDAALKF